VRTIERGDAAPTLARQAEAGRAGYIVMGLGRHGLVDRLLGSETALRVLRLADAPVLAVAPGSVSLPRRVIVALDFSPASLRAARASLPLLAPNATVYLVHVEPRVDLPPGDWTSWEMSREGGIAAAFGRAIEEIGFPAEMCVETITLRGDPGKELLDLARASRAELIVVGSHGYGFVERMLLGSVATKVLRGACCSVLAVPPMRDELCRSCTVDVDEAPVECVAPESWATWLAAFTRRNFRRSSRLEEVGPAIGAQHELERGALVGASYDRHDGRITLMLDTPGGHLTRSVSRPTHLYAVRGADARDALLRIAHPDGQTLLALGD
jgi:nucleotide-binding universal stress UspA family protein